MCCMSLAERLDASADFRPFAVKLSLLPRGESMLSRPLPLAPPLNKNSDAMSAWLRLWPCMVLPSLSALAATSLRPMEGGLGSGGLVLVGSAECGVLLVLLGGVRAWLSGSPSLLAPVAFVLPMAHGLPGNLRKG